MKFGAGQLGALVAVVREGSFERAARVLHVTPSAVSQRIKQLEEQLGSILVVRASPCVATPTGDAVYRHALQLELLEQDLLRRVTPDPADPSDPPIRLTIAVNADSLATWLVPALQTFSTRARARIEIAIDDEGHTAQWLRSGRVVGAVTSQARPVQGCDVRPLGVMRYLATASPRFTRRWFADGCTPAAMAAAPSLAYNRKDLACDKFLVDELRDDVVELQPQYFPSPHAYLDACRRGLGWGLNPHPLAAPLVKRRRLVDLFPGRGLDVPLYWQQWSITSTTVSTLGTALREHAEASLESR